MPRQTRAQRPSAPRAEPTARPTDPGAAKPLLAISALLVLGCGASFPEGPTVEETESFEEPFRAGELLDLRNVSGGIEVRAWDREAAEIVARKVGRSRAALDEVGVEVKRSSRGLEVRTRYPRKRRMWGKRHGSVHYSIRVPARADLRIASIHGPVEVIGISGVVEAQTVNGSLRLKEHRGSVNAKTVNGRIECELDSFREGEKHSFRTVNGRVQLTLTPDARGRVDARAINGRVTLDVADLEHLDTPSRRRQTVQIGEGGGECQVRTVNGAIHVLADGS